MDEGTHSVLGAVLAGLDQSGGTSSSSCDWTIAVPICTLQVVRPGERCAGVAEQVLFVINKGEVV